MKRATSTSLRVLTVCWSMHVLLGTADSSASSHYGYNLSLPGNIPEELTPPVPTKLLNVFLGVGYQEYTFNGTNWLNTNASALLFDLHGREIGRHFFLLPISTFLPVYPYFQSYHPFSSTTARKLAVVLQDSAVPLLLLEALATSGDPKYFGGAAYIQRLETRGGLPPTSPMFPTPGQIHRSSYVAHYAFYRTTSKGGPGTVREINSAQSLGGVGSTKNSGP